MCELEEVPGWLARIEAEYREMPGLQLTERQMQRLWGLDGATCAVMIAVLVATNVLFETPKHSYALVATSHVTRQR